MNLFLLRHAPAVERGTPGFDEDSARPLTPEGRAKMKRIVTGLEAGGIRFDLILSSPYLRASQTAEVVAAKFRTAGKPVFTDHLRPGGSLRQLVEELRSKHRERQQVLLVGHEPDLSQHISVWLTGKPGLGLELKKGGLCKLEIASLRAGRCAILQWLLTPRHQANLR
jgi:phosphohistidine phosphatase